MNQYKRMMFSFILLCFSNIFYAQAYQKPTADPETGGYFLYKENNSDKNPDIWFAYPLGTFPLPIDYETSVKSTLYIYINAAGKSGDQAGLLQINCDPDKKNGFFYWFIVDDKPIEESEILSIIPNQIIEKATKLFCL